MKKTAMAAVAQLVVVCALGSGPIRRRIASASQQQLDALVVAFRSEKPSPGLVFAL